MLLLTLLPGWFANVAAIVGCRLTSVCGRGFESVVVSLLFGFAMPVADWCLILRATATASAACLFCFVVAMTVSLRRCCWQSVATRVVDLVLSVC